MPDRTPGEESVLRDGPQLNAREVRDAAEAKGTRTRLDPEREVTAPPVTDDRAQGPPVADQAAGARAGYAQAETALGGADSVQKTTWGVGSGTEPDGRQEFAPVGRKKGDGSVVARTSAGGGINPIAWVVGALALVVFLLYAAGIVGGAG